MLFSSLTTVDNANYATFVSEYDEINSPTQATLKNNVLNGNSEAERNAGFTKAKVENAPGSFVSVSEDSISGYVIDLDTIKVSGTKTGKGEIINETVTFGKDDVYVYDNEGKVYYAKGYTDSEGNLKYRLEEYDNISTQPTIASIDVVLNETKTAATVKVTVAAANGGALTVTGGGKTATKIDENLYQLEITRNGTIVIMVRETGGGSAMRTITISGIEKAKYTVTYDANGGTASTVPSSQTKKYNKDITLSSSKPSRRRCTFKGWATSEDNQVVEYHPGDIYSENATATLYAVWESNLIPSIANGPKLNTNEMVAVYWSDENASVEQTDTSFEIPNSGGLYNTTLYNYNINEEAYLSGIDTYSAEWAQKLRWANAKTSDGSYWVWIPRYAYKLIYYTNSDRTIESSTKTAYGDVDILFMYETSNTQYRNASGEAVDLPEGYTVHPAFQTMDSGDLDNRNMLGKWSEELTGIWVAKYEASREISSDGKIWTAASGTNGKTTNAGNTSETLSRVVSKPSVTSWRSIENKYIYQNCLKMNETLNTHQMKNSEWGAVAYLTYSPYGRNGNELAVNQCSSYYTGAGLGSGTSTIYNSTYSYSADTFDTTYAWNTDLGKLTSTTGNIYGIYDMSGGAWEYTASYVNNEHDNLMIYGNESTNGGYNLVDNSNISVDILKTKQIYDSTVSDGSDSQSSDYALCKDDDGNLRVYGDAVYETSPSYSSYGWCADYSYFPYSNIPFFKRGGNYDDTNSAGVFDFYDDNGGDDSYGGFRPVVCVSPGT